jgi:ElaA protein
MTFHLKPFPELTLSELYDLMQLRAEVFVVEQNCAYQDLDGKDKEALHLCGYFHGELVAYARLLAPGVSYKECAIGRVVVSPRYRGKSFGIELMKRAMEECQKKFKTEVIIISAQKYLEKFYTGLGFISEGDTYLEDDIPHVKMRHLAKES